ncbi:MAG: family 43 glycosylhydrolase [Kiritimatiellaeota bacterium]|nr:family 43 glycosylhydrolase [Kiritimatiellota bacterium]
MTCKVSVGSDSAPVVFRYSPAIPYEPGVTRRDPSPVVQLHGVYHVWYTRATHDSSGYFGEVWHASSPDGRRWTEQGPALRPGPPGAWDSNGVFTPTILLAQGRCYLFYTAVPAPFDNDRGGPRGTPTALGAAVADTPDGPWRKFHRNPILIPSSAPAAPDSHRVDDACLIVRNGQYWLYYKGRQSGKTPGETVMCLAVARDPLGPYVKSPANPIIRSGHEVCVWPQGSGVAALVSRCGPEGGTLQYSPDGIHFAATARVDPPAAPGPYRADGFLSGSGPGIRWGLCHDAHSADRPFLLRFDCERQTRPQSEPE